MLRTVITCLLFFLILGGCSINKSFYVENDNYSKYYDYYINDIKIVDPKEYKLMAVFNDNASLRLAKNRISLIKKELLNKVDIYVIIIYPYEKNNSQSFKKIFNYLNSFYSFLKTTKQYKNNLYTIGVPQKHIDYQVLIYFKHTSNKER